MAGLGEGDEPAPGLGNRSGDLLRVGQRRHRVELTRHHQHRALHPRQAGQQLHGLLLAAGAGEEDVFVHQRARPRHRVAGRGVVDVAAVCVVGRPGFGARLRPEGACRRAGLGPAEARESFHLAFQPQVVAGAAEHHLGRVCRVARQVTLRDEAAEALAEHDGFLDAESFAELHHVVGEGVQRPLGRGARAAAAVAAVVDVDDLRDIGQTAEQRLETVVVVARPAVQQDERGLLAQPRAVGHEAGAFDVDKQAHAGFEGDEHR